MASHESIHLYKRSSSSGGSGVSGAEVGQSGLIGTAVVVRALEAKRVRKHTHDLVRCPSPVSLRPGSFGHALNVLADNPWPSLAMWRGGIVRYVFLPYFRRIFLMSEHGGEYGPKYA